MTLVQARPSTHHARPCTPSATLRTEQSPHTRRPTSQWPLPANTLEPSLVCMHVPKLPAKLHEVGIRQSDAPRRKLAPRMLRPCAASSGASAGASANAPPPQFQQTVGVLLLATCMHRRRVVRTRAAPPGQWEREREQDFRAVVRQSSTALAPLRTRLCWTSGRHYLAWRNSALACPALMTLRRCDRCGAAWNPGDDRQASSTLRRGRSLSRSVASHESLRRSACGSFCRGHLCGWVVERLLRLVRSCVMQLAVTVHRCGRGHSWRLSGCCLLLGALVRRCAGGGSADGFRFMLLGSAPVFAAEDERGGGGFGEGEAGAGRASRNREESIACRRRGPRRAAWGRGSSPSCRGSSTSSPTTPCRVCERPSMPASSFGRTVARPTSAASSSSA